MAVIISPKKTRIALPDRSEDIFGTSKWKRIRGYLPEGLMAELIETGGALVSGGRGRIEEIRLRKSNRVCLTLGDAGEKRNLILKYEIGKDELSDILARMCDGSLYAYSESISKGCISIGGGIRVGVCGRASVENGRIIGVYDISALNIRLPHRCVALDGALLKRINECVARGEGVLIYSPPGRGKTTLLRSLAYGLSKGDSAMRISLIDSRHELAIDDPDGESHSLDILSGYPKPVGIAIATAFMNPQIIMCDEIGGTEEAQSILEAQNCGVPLIATAHGESTASILRRPAISALHKAGVFGMYVGVSISRSGGFLCDICSYEEAEAACENNRNNSALL